ncbi:MAG: ABC transporter ATP-binding protein [Proteobacteria bacterium]|nr:ABC transporter ATP-binding protein [Pseudomonadota bacterium]
MEANTDTDERHPPGRDSNGDVVVRVRGLGKRFHLQSKASNRFSKSFSKLLGLKEREDGAHDFWALRGVDFALEKGEVLGVIGSNGAGKSTLLQLVAGISRPTEGEIFLSGRVAAILELGSGFNPEFTGRENVFINGAILGFSRRELAGRFGEIEEFAEIGEFMDQPVKFYSNGMFLRLSFAVHMCLEPEILLVDEILSVGDIFFQKKCLGHIEAMMADGKSMILVSHDLWMIRRYSARVLVLDHGKPVFLGEPLLADSVYQELNRKKAGERSESFETARKISHKPPTGFPARLPEWPHERDFRESFPPSAITGDKESVRILRVALLNEEGRPSKRFAVGDDAWFYYEFEALKDLGVPLGGVILENAYNVIIHGKTSLEHLPEAAARVRAGARVRFRQRIQLSVEPGKYSFMVGFGMEQSGDCVSPEKLTPEGSLLGLKQLLRVHDAGSFIVEDSDPQKRVFLGCADLPGNCLVEVMAPDLPEPLEGTES